MKESLFQHTPDNNLLIRVHPQGILYSITDENEQVILQQTINMPTQKLNDDQFLTHFFDQPELRVLSENVSIIFENSDYQLIPNELFRENDIQLLFDLEFGKNEGSRLTYNVLPQWGAHLAYRVEESLIAFFEKKYPDAEIEHHIFRLLRNKIAKNTNAVYVNLQKDNIDILIINDNKLLLVNSFSVKTDEDICFFILNAYEQLDIDTNLVPLKIFSEDAVSEKFISLIKQYIVNVEVK